METYSPAFTFLRAEGEVNNRMLTPVTGGQHQTGMLAMSKRSNFPPQRLAMTYSWFTRSSSSEDDAVSSRSRAITTGISFRVCHAVNRQRPQRPFFLAVSLDQTIWIAQTPARKSEDFKYNAGRHFRVLGTIFKNK